MTHRSTLLLAVAALGIPTLVGIAGYMSLSGMGFVDALYMTVITLSTVGFQEVQPLGTTGRLFTVVLLVGGLGVVFYAVGAIARDMIEGEVQRTIGRHRVERRISKLSGHYIVCGFGRMGSVVCKELAAKPAKFVVIDRDHEAIQRAQADEYLCIEADVTADEDAVLRQAGIQQARGLVAALPTDSDNVYAVLTARELNPGLQIVTRAENAAGERKLMLAGATRVVSPYRIGGHRIANALLRPGVLEVVDLATHYRGMELQIEEITVAERTFPDGTSLQGSGLRERLGIIVIAIKKKSGQMVFKPQAEDRIEAGDRLIVMGEGASLRTLAQQLQVG